jgi:hypothetical protein
MSKPSPPKRGKPDSRQTALNFSPMPSISAMPSINTMVSTTTSFDLTAPIINTVNTTTSSSTTLSDNEIKRNTPIIPDDPLPTPGSGALQITYYLRQRLQKIYLKQPTHPMFGPILRGELRAPYHISDPINAVCWYNLVGAIFDKTNFRIPVKIGINQCWMTKTDSTKITMQIEEEEIDPVTKKVVKKLKRRCRLSPSKE